MSETPTPVAAAALPGIGGPRRAERHRRAHFTHIASHGSFAPIIGAYSALLGRARELIGYTFVRFMIDLPLVLFLLWALGATLTYHPPTP